MRIEVEMFVHRSDVPAEISPELVLVSPPEEARAAREALTEPRPQKSVPVSSAAPRAEVLRQVVPAEAPVVEARPSEPQPATFAPPPPPPTPAAPVRRRRSRWLLLAFAAVLAAGGFLVGRELGDRHGNGSAAPRPATAQSLPQRAEPTGQAQSAGTRAQSTSSAAGKTQSTSSAAVGQSTRSPHVEPPPVVSWRARPGVRHYRLDLVRGGAVVLTILTDEPRADIPLTFPNAGRRSHLAPGAYEWRVRAATARPSGVLAHGTVMVH
jgi:hypothetical protein